MQNDCVIENSIHISLPKSKEMILPLMDQSMTQWLRWKIVDRGFMSGRETWFLIGERYEQASAWFGCQLMHLIPCGWCKLLLLFYYMMLSGPSRLLSHTPPCVGVSGHLTVRVCLFGCAADFLWLHLLSAYVCLFSLQSQPLWLQFNVIRCRVRSASALTQRITAVHHAVVQMMCNNIRVHWGGVSFYSQKEEHMEEK